MRNQFRSFAAAQGGGQNRHVLGSILQTNRPCVNFQSVLSKSCPNLGKSSVWGKQLLGEKKRGRVQRGGESEKYPAPLEDYNLIQLLPKNVHIPVKSRTRHPITTATTKKYQKGQNLFWRKKNRAEERGGRGESEFSPAL